MSNGNGRKQRLELTWIGKDERPRLEPRILLPVTEQSYSKGKPGDGGIHDNILIHGDNLLALKALEREFAGKVKCIFIDPPYNTGAAFEQYDDGLEHSLWLGLIRDRLERLRALLRDDGTLWVSIDDRECHYLKVLLDELFGRSNFVCTIAWQSKDTPSNNATGMSQTHNFILVYRKSESWKPLLLQRSEEQTATYKNPDNDPRGPWLGSTLTRGEHRDRDYYALTNMTGREIFPPKGSSWRRPQSEIGRLIAEGRVYWGQNGDADFPKEKKYLSEVKEGVVPQTWWPYEFAGSTRNASAEMKQIFSDQAGFDTPKPEKLIYRILGIATNPGDIVLDSFAGSGTTGAVAQKMGRRWIMVELGEHASTHIVPRLKKVIDGQELGGITEAVGWKGGGGFRMFRLAPSLIEEDQFGQKIISKKYNAAMLAEAMCKHMGFTYAPSTKPEEFWKQGHSSEHDFIHTTTKSLTYDTLKALSLEVGKKRTLKVCCKAFRARLSDFPNLTVVKIPQAVLDKCEWGRDDYSLNIARPPEDAAGISDAEPDDDGGNGGEPAPGRRGGRRDVASVPVTETRAEVAKKAPLKMDGTTRVPRNAKPPTLVAPPPSAAAAKLTTQLAPKKGLANKKAAKPPVKGTKSKAEAEEATKTTTPKKVQGAKKSAKSKPAPKAKSRRAADSGQGTLL